MQFKQRINIKIDRINEIIRVKSPKRVFYPALKRLNVDHCNHFNINEHDKYDARLS